MYKERGKPRLNINLVRGSDLFGSACIEEIDKRLHLNPARTRVLVMGTVYRERDDSPTTPA